MNIQIKKSIKPVKYTIAVKKLEKRLEDILKGKRDAKTGYASLGGGLEIPESYVDSLLDVLTL